MAIELTRTQIERALRRIAPGLDKYCWLQAQRDRNNLRTDLVYRRRFNHFYRVRRNTDWQDKFYGLLERKKRRAVTFSEVLQALLRATGRYEASFSSKLVATIRPEMPVIDSVVLWNLKLTPPRYNARNRAARLNQLHQTLVSSFRSFLGTETGRYLVKRFREKYPDGKVSKVKMLDFILWQTRPNNAVHRTGARVARSGR